MKLAPYELLACMMYVSYVLYDQGVVTPLLLGFMYLIQSIKLVKTSYYHLLLLLLHILLLVDACCYTEDRVHEVFIFYFSFSFHSHYLG
jgi:hypothetical protein